MTPGVRVETQIALIDVSIGLHKIASWMHQQQDLPGLEHIDAWYPQIDDCARLWNRYLQRKGLIPPHSDPTRTAAVQMLEQFIAALESIEKPPELAMRLHDRLRALIDTVAAARSKVSDSAGLALLELIESRCGKLLTELERQQTAQR